MDTHGSDVDPGRFVHEERLDRLRREGESWDEFPSRMLPSDKPIDVGAWSDETAGRARKSIKAFVKYGISLSVPQILTSKRGTDCVRSGLCRVFFRFLKIYYHFGVGFIVGFRHHIN